MKIFILYHDNESFNEALKISQFNKEVFIPINTGQTKLFENNIYNILHDNEKLYKDAEIIGIIPYSLLTKMNSNPKEVIEYINKNKDEYDVLPIFGINDFIKIRNNVIMPYIDTCAKMHGSHTFIALFNILNLFYPATDIMSTKHKAFFCNAFVAKRIIVEKYIKFFKKTIEIIDNDIFISDLLNRYSYYDGKLSPEYLRNLSGYSYYTAHPFFFERLICLYFNLEKYNICEPLKQTKNIFYD